MTEVLWRTRRHTKASDDIGEENFKKLQESSSAYHKKNVRHVTILISENVQESTPKVEYHILS